VVSHNLMDCLKPECLRDTYHRRLRGAIPCGGASLAVLCLQENVPLEQSSCGKRTRPLQAGAVLGAAVAPSFRVSHHPQCPRLATAYDFRRLRLLSQRCLVLPRLASLSPLEALYIKGGRPEEKHALVSVFLLTRCRRPRGRVRWPVARRRARPREGRLLVVANLHLDAAGTNTFRAAQMGAVAEHLGRHLGHGRRWRQARGDLAIVAGDTNCFAISRQHQAEDLQAILHPLQELGLQDMHHDLHPDTHWFSRADEPKFIHQLMVALGRLGVDMPRRYDVIASNAPRLESGVLRTPESDHDLVWATLRTATPPSTQRRPQKLRSIR